MESFHNKFNGALFASPATMASRFAIKLRMPFMNQFFNQINCWNEAVWFLGLSKLIKLLQTSQLRFVNQRDRPARVNYLGSVCPQDAILQYALNGRP